MCSKPSRISATIAVTGDGPRRPRRPRPMRHRLLARPAACHAWRAGSAWNGGSGGCQLMEFSGKPQTRPASRPRARRCGRRRSCQSALAQARIVVAAMQRQHVGRRGSVTSSSSRANSALRRSAASSARSSSGATGSPAGRRTVPASPAQWVLVGRPKPARPAAQGPSATASSTCSPASGAREGIGAGLDVAGLRRLRGLMSPPPAAFRGLMSPPPRLRGLMAPPPRLRGSTGRPAAFSRVPQRLAIGAPKTAQSASAGQGFSPDTTCPGCAGISSVRCPTTFFSRARPAPRPAAACAAPSGVGGPLGVDLVCRSRTNVGLATHGEGGHHRRQDVRRHWPPRRGQIAPQAASVYGKRHAADPREHG